MSAIHMFINLILYKDELPDQWKGSIIVPFTKSVIKLAITIIVGYQCYQYHT
jgi:hypothetical protein